MGKSSDILTYIDAKKNAYKAVISIKYSTIKASSKQDQKQDLNFELKTNLLRLIITLKKHSRLCLNAI